MTNEELRIKCAEAVGWKWERDKRYPSDKNYWLWNPKGEPIDGDVENRILVHLLPNYPTSLDACKELIEFAISRGVEVTVEVTVYFTTVKNCVRVGFHTGDIRDRIIETAETPELAICKAFLKWKGVL